VARINIRARECSVPAHVRDQRILAHNDEPRMGWWSALGYDSRRRFMSKRAFDVLAWLGAAGG
jgi:hypothetical protein